MPVPFLMNEGQHMDHFGNIVCSTYVDFRKPADRLPITRLVKGCRSQYAMEVIGQVRISRPSMFRTFGENLIRDANEVRPEQEEVIYEAVDDLRDLERAKQRDEGLNRASRLVGVDWKTKASSVRKTYSEGQSFSTGKNSWIFCTSIEPSIPDEWKQWSETLDKNYDHISCIYRPREFARELASSVAENLESSLQEISLTHSFEGQPDLHTEHPMQLVFHGPVIYVDDAFGMVEAATSKHELALLPFFAKDEKYKAQREYRFVIFEGTVSDELYIDLPIPTDTVGIVGAEDIDVASQWMPDSPLTKGELAATANDMTSQSDPDSGIDIERDLPLGRQLTEDNSIETTLFRAFSRTNNPATVYRPHEVSSDDLPEDLQVVTATYSSVQALRSKVRSFLEADEESPERKLKVTSAAWYAEQDIRELCQEFSEPILGVSISPEGDIVIHITLSDWPELKGGFAVTSTGESVYRLKTPRRHLISRKDFLMPSKNIAKGARELFERLIEDSESSKKNDQF